MAQQPAQQAQEPQEPEACAGEPTVVPPGWLTAAESLLNRADSADAWVTVAQRPTTVGAEQWWHAMHAWTSGRSFMRTVWRIDVDQPFPSAPAAGGRPDDEPRRWALRRLQRKIPVVCRDARGSTSLDMLEYAMHEPGRRPADPHRCVFGVVLPAGLTDLCGYFPHTYPRSWMYAFTYTPSATGAGAALRMLALPLSFQSLGPGPAAPIAPEAEREIPVEHLEKGALKVLTMAHKWGAKHTPLANTTAQGCGWGVWSAARSAPSPQRRVPFDVLVPEAMYRTAYNRLKEQYGRPWVENWPEKTDAQKFVYEEVGIAAYLLCLCEQNAPSQSWFPRARFRAAKGCGCGGRAVGAGGGAGTMAGAGDGRRAAADLC